MANQTLYVTDLDGTLLNTNDKINPFSIKVINELVEKGMIFTYATARSLVSASVVTKGLSTNLPVIAYNGGLIINPSTNKILSQEKFSQEEMEYITSTLNKLNISPIVYSYVNGVEKLLWNVNKENDGIKRYFSLRQGDKRLNPIDNPRDLYHGDMFYFTCIGEKEELLPVFNQFKNDERFNCTMNQELYRPEYWCEIMPVKTTKFDAIVKLKKILHCDKVVSFGDSSNDIPMFKISDECYAVENAVPELKKYATGIIPCNDKDGVALWLKENAQFD